MDECLIHSIFDAGVTPGRVAFGRAQSPPPSPPPNTIAPIDSFPLTMLDGAHCVVNKRPKVDWFIEQVNRSFVNRFMSAGDNSRLGSWFMNYPLQLLSLMRNLSSLCLGSFSACRGSTLT